MRITKSTKTDQWLCTACVAALEKPPEPTTPPPSSSPKEQKDKEAAES